MRNVGILALALVVHLDRRHGDVALEPGDVPAQHGDGIHERRAHRVGAADRAVARAARTPGAGEHRSSARRRDLGRSVRARARRHRTVRAPRRSAQVLLLSRWRPRAFPCATTCSASRTGAAWRRRCVLLLLLLISNDVSLRRSGHAGGSRGSGGRTGPRRSSWRTALAYQWIETRHFGRWIAAVVFVTVVVAAMQIDGDRRMLARSASRSVGSGWRSIRAGAVLSCRALGRGHCSRPWPRAFHSSSPWRLHAASLANGRESLATRRGSSSRNAHGLVMHAEHSRLAAARVHTPNAVGPRLPHWGSAVRTASTGTGSRT